VRAQHLYNRDQHYVVQDGEVIISMSSPAA